MAMVYEFGTKDVTLLTGQKIALECKNGSAVVYYSTFPVSPEVYYEATRFTNTQITLGTFAADRKIRIEANTEPVEYVMGTAPVVSQLRNQGAATAKTVSATLTAAELMTGILTANQGGAAAAVYTLPLATAMDTELPDSAANHSFEFSLINLSTVAAEDASIATNTGWTLVGSMAVQSDDAITSKSAGRFRARKTAAGAWTLYRIS